MDDQIRDDQNVRVVNANKNLADKNGAPDNTGNTDHNTLPVGVIPGPLGNRDGATASSSSVPPPL